MKIYAHENSPLYPTQPNQLHPSYTSWDWKASAFSQFLHCLFFFFFLASHFLSSSSSFLYHLFCSPRPWSSPSPPGWYSVPLVPGLPLPPQGDILFSSSLVFIFPHRVIFCSPRPWSSSSPTGWYSECYSQDVLIGIRVTMETRRASSPSHMYSCWMNLSRGFAAHKLLRWVT